LDVALLDDAAQDLAIAIHLAQLDFRMFLVASPDDQVVDLLALACLDREMKLQHNTFSQKRCLPSLIQADAPPRQLTMLIEGNFSLRNTRWEGANMAMRQVDTLFNNYLSASRAAAYKALI
jgi:hypothetical protein